MDELVDKCTGPTKLGTRHCAVIIFIEKKVNIENTKGKVTCRDKALSQSGSRLRSRSPERRRALLTESAITYSPAMKYFRYIIFDKQKKNRVLLLFTLRSLRFPVPCHPHTAYHAECMEAESESETESGSSCGSLVEMSAPTDQSLRRVFGVQIASENLATSFTLCIEFDGRHQVVK